MFENSFSVIRFRHQLRGILLLVALLVTVSGAVLAGAQEADGNPAIVASADGITVPDELFSGITTITLQNDTDSEFQPALMRFIDGKTLDDFTAAMMAQDVPGMLATVSALGTPFVAPGEAVDVTYDLQAGDYVLIHFNADGPPTLLPFAVTDLPGSVHEAPEADVEVTMLDYAFEIPAELVTGEALWQFTNGGEQTHELVIYAVDPDATAEDVTSTIMEAVMSTPPGTAWEIPFEVANAFAGISPGETAWMTVDLPPGTYAVVCMVPDFTSTPPITHLQHGMIALLTVSE